MKKELFSKIRCALFFIVLYASWIIPCFMKYHEDYGTQEQEEMIECTEDVLRFRIDDVDVSVEELEVELVSEPQLVSLGEFRLSAYCACNECTDGDGITATGTVATQGRTVAVDPKVIPYGTVLIIDGYGEYIAEDNGIGQEKIWIQGNEIDIFFEDHDEAWDFGIQYAEVFMKESN